MLKWILIGGAAITVYVLTKPSYANGCFSMINPFASGQVSGTGFAAVNAATDRMTWSWCPFAVAGAPTGNIAAANIPIPTGVTNTDTGGLNSNAS
jgi:hypothetical protein